MTDRLDAEYVAQAVDIPRLARDEGHVVRKRGKTWMLQCPTPQHLDRKPSCSIYHQSGKWKWFCHSCKAGGDGIAWFRQVHGLDFKQALQRAAAFAGLADDPNCTLSEAEKEQIRRANRAKAKRAVEEGERKDRLKKAWQLKSAGDFWRFATPVNEGDGHLVIDYLASRGIDAKAIAHVVGDVTIPALRFAWLPYLPWNKRPPRKAPWYGKVFPVMVACVQRYGEDRKPHFAGVHLTYLRRDGGGKADLGQDPEGDPYNAKIMWGDIDRGAIRLAPAVDRKLVLCEGIETGLSIMQMALNDGRDPPAVWPCLTQVGLSKVVLPMDVDHVDLACDPVGSSQAAIDNHATFTKRAERNAQWRPRNFGAKRSVRVIIPPASAGDFNDQLMAKARGEHVELA